MDNLNKSKKFHRGLFHNPKLLFWFYILVNMVPSLYFFFTEPLNLAGKLVIIFFAFGLYVSGFSLFKNPGKWQVFFFPVLFLHAFQIVLFYLFGRDVIAANMFLNVVTTNSSEVNELLGALLPSIFLVVFLYLPPTVLGVLQWRNKNILAKSYRSRTLKLGLISLSLALIFSLFSKDQNTGKFAYHKDIYPINLFYNLGFATQKFYKIRNYPETAKDFTFKASREKNSTTHRKIIVMVVGETSRPDNWELFGYERNNNPKLKKEENLILYKDALTQSNVTHESVPIILSGVGAENFKDLYHQKGIFQAFKEAGFTTISLSNQAENSSFIEHIYKQADIYKNLKAMDSRTGFAPNPPDEELTFLMEEMIEQQQGDLFILLHSYGSHFNYMDRYPKEFKKFQPDKVTNVSKKQKQEMVNAYDNSILYTDYFLAKTIKVLKQTEASSFLFFSSDHGEDIFDDKRGKFLHASPTPTYYQLRIAALSWFSEKYQAEHPEKIQSALKNKDKPTSTNMVFHTLLDAANISTPYFKKELSLINEDFKIDKRLFLTDHEEAIPYLQLNLRKVDLQMLDQNNIQP